MFVFDSFHGCYVPMHPMLYQQYMEDMWRRNYGAYPFSRHMENPKIAKKPQQKPTEKNLPIIEYIFDKNSHRLIPYFTNGNGTVTSEYEKRKMMEKVDKSINLDKDGFCNLFYTKDKIYFGRNETINNRSYLINLTKKVFSKPQSFYFLGFPKLTNLYDVVFSRILSKKKLEMSKYPRHLRSLLKLFYACLSVCFIKTQDFNKAASFYNKAISIDTKMTIDSKEKEKTNQDHMEETYINLFLAHYCFFAGKTNQSIWFAESGYKSACKRQGCEKDLHSINAYFQVCCYLNAQEFFGVIKNLVEGNDPQTTQNTFSEDYNLLHQYRKIDESNLYSFLKSKKKFWYGEANITVVNAILIKIRVHLMKQDLSKKELIERFDILEILIPIISKFPGNQTRLRFKFSILSMQMQICFLLGEKTQTNQIANQIFKILKYSNFELGNFEDSHAIFFVTNYFCYYYQEEQGNNNRIEEQKNLTNTWIKKSRDCVVFAKKQAENSVLFVNPFKILTGLLYSNSYYSDIFQKTNANTNDSSNEGKNDLNENSSESNESYINAICDTGNSFKISRSFVFPNFGDTSLHIDGFKNYKHSIALKNTLPFSEVMKYVQSVKLKEKKQKNENPHEYSDFVVSK